MGKKGVAASITLGRTKVLHFRSPDHRMSTGLFSFFAVLCGLLLLATCPTPASGASAVATYHLYAKGQPASTFFCGLPLAVNHAGALRVTAIRTMGAGGFRCGDCVRVRNRASGRSTVVRIIDQGGIGGMDLSQEAFNAIDTPGKAGYAAGRMSVRYTKTHCGSLRSAGVAHRRRRR